MAKKKGKKLLKREPKLFKYNQPYNRPDPYFAMLNNIQNQAHIGQVNSLIRELRQAQEFAKRARQQAIDELERPVGPVHVDDHAPSTMADIGTDPMPRTSWRTRGTQTTIHAPSRYPLRETHQRQQRHADLQANTDDPISRYLQNSLRGV